MKTYFTYTLARQDRSEICFDIPDSIVRSLAELEESSNLKGEKMNLDLHLVYFKEAENIFSAMKCKMEFGKWDEEYKKIMIDKFNPEWKDLFLKLLFARSTEEKLTSKN